MVKPIEPLMDKELHTEFFRSCLDAFVRPAARM